MKSFHCVWRLMAACALGIGLSSSLSAQRIDLTGFWQDNAGGKYQLPQVGSNVFWLDDGRPSYIKHVLRYG